MTTQTHPHALSASQVVNAPAAAVWEVLGDFPAVSTWAPSVVRSYALEGKERGPDAARHCEIKGFGSIQEFVTDWREGSGFTYRVTPVGPIGGSTMTWSVESIDAKHSRVHVHIAWSTRFGPIGSLLNVLMLRRKLGQGTKEGLLALKRRVETGRAIRPPNQAPHVTALAS